MNKKVDNYLRKTIWYHPSLAPLLLNFLSNSQLPPIIPQILFKNESLILPNKNYLSFEKTIIEVLEKDNVSEFEFLSMDKVFSYDMCLLAKSNTLFENYSLPILFHAILNNSIQCFKFLILNGANPHLLIKYGNNDLNSISISIITNNTLIFKILEDNLVQYTDICLYFASLYSRHKILKKIIWDYKNKLTNQQIKLGLLGAIQSDNLKGFNNIFKISEQNLLDNDDYILF